MASLLVLDASAALAMLLAEEEGAGIVRAVESTVAANGQLFVPAVFWYELGNGLLNAERRQRMKHEAVVEAGRLFSRLPIVTQGASDLADRQRIHELARSYILSFYDASYLELALRYHAALATCDAHLLHLKGTFPALFAASETST
jgi:predicted nucleic acid-binding protein